MIRFVMTRLEDGGRDVPVPTRVRGRDVDAVDEGSPDCEGEVRWKKSVGTEPHVSGPMKDAIADPPGCRNRSNLCTSFGVLPPWEKRGLMISRRGPHCMINSTFERRGVGWSELSVMLKFREACLCSCRRREKAPKGWAGLYVNWR